MKYSKLKALASQKKIQEKRQAQAERMEYLKNTEPYNLGKFGDFKHSGPYYDNYHHVVYNLLKEVNNDSKRKDKKIFVHSNRS